MTTIKIKNLNDLLNAAYATQKRFGGTHVWWRGQGKIDWDVSPQLYQKGFAQNERNLSLLFLNKAKVRHDKKCPSPTDYASWLFLMHQFSVPTRLLDWSESILVASYFAVAEKKLHDQPGALWALEPTLLNNQQINRKAIMVHQEEEASSLIREVFEGSNNGSGDKILAVLTDQMDVKHVVQYSTYTLHGTAMPINQLPCMEKFLVKFEIPVQAKPQLLQALELLGIKSSFLFPDLEHLADDLRRIQFN